MLNTFKNILAPGEGLQGRLFRLAAVFLVLNALALTLSPITRNRTIEVALRWGHWVAIPVWLVVFYFIRRAQTRVGFNTDPFLLPITALLTGWGLMSIWRLTTTFGLRQTLWLAVVGAVFIAGLRISSDLSILRRYKYLWLFGGLGLTLLTFFFGTNPTGVGPHLWLGCCGVYFQPSEPLKLLLIVYLAAYLADRQAFTPGLLALLAPTLVMAGLALLLLVIQQDLGTASIFIFIYSGMIYVATGRRRTLLFSLLTLLISGVAGYLLFDVVRLRVDAWINPWLDPSGRSFQIVQSLIAIASGGMAGRGPGLGNPGLVPISHSDFIFSTIAEEFGMLGVVALLLLIALFALRGIRIGMNAANRFHRYLAFGIGLYFASQSLLIIGGNIRMLPLTGVTLPFVSYGGSSLLTSFLALLLLTHIQNYAPENPLPKQRDTPYLVITAVILVGFASAALLNSWWALWRGPDLLTRTDNARRTISDRFVPRGTIRDRNGLVLAQTTGDSGEYFREYLHGGLSPVVGYTHIFFGQAGAEASLDPILRGIENQNPWVVWYHHLLYGQSPPGLDIKLTLDLQRQTDAENLLGSTPGAVVLLNAENGQILALASSPSYDANHLEETWDDLIQSSGAPLLNRATLGSYPAGAALGPFLLAETGVNGSLPDAMSQNLDCVRQPPEQPTWAQAVYAGCSAPLADLGLRLEPAGLNALFESLGFYTAPELRLPAVASPPLDAITRPGAEAAGQGDLRLSPLQLALAAAALTNQGIRPAPQFLLEIENPAGGWDPSSPQGEPIEAFDPQTAARVAYSLAHDSLPIWETTATAVTTSGGTVTWYLGGTLPDQSGDPYVVVALLETDNPNLAQTIGHRLLQDLLD